MRATLLVTLALSAVPASASCQAGRTGIPWDLSDSIVVVEGRRLSLRVSAWRDFMPRPGGAQAGSDLMINLQVFTLDSAPLPVGLRVDSAWARSKEGVWRAAPSEEPRPDLPNGLDLMLRGGPEWATDQRIDVLIRLRLPSGTTSYLGVLRQPIGRTM